MCVVCVLFVCCGCIVLVLRLFCHRFRWCCVWFVLVVFVLAFAFVAVPVFALALCYVVVVFYVSCICCHRDMPGCLCCHCVALVLCLLGVRVCVCVACVLSMCGVCVVFEFVLRCVRV